MTPGARVRLPGIGSCFNVASPGIALALVIGLHLPVGWMGLISFLGKGLCSSNLKGVPGGY